MLAGNHSAYEVLYLSEYSGEFGVFSWCDTVCFCEKCDLSRGNTNGIGKPMPSVIPSRTPKAGQKPSLNRTVYLFRVYAGAWKPYPLSCFAPVVRHKDMGPLFTGSGRHHPFVLRSYQPVGSGKLQRQAQGRSSGPLPTHRTTVVQGCT